MNVLVNTSTRFISTPDGLYWAPSENLAYTYWTRFLSVFEGVNVIARVVAATEPPRGARPACGPGVNVTAISDYQGLIEFGRSYRAVRSRVKQALRSGAAVYLSLPCVIGSLMWRLLERDRPFGVGVCGDPFDALSPHAMTHPIRPVLRWWFSRALRLQCQSASACTYVTKDVLQRRYPCAPGAFSTHYSSINLPPDAIVNGLRTNVRREGPFHLITVCSFDSWYKGQDILLLAVSACIERGLDLMLTFVGGGKYLQHAQSLAEKLSINGRVKFLGQLPFSAAVRSELDSGDLFVLPSQSEGLPKAMIEAMARALPCIGTSVGGIPELLPAEDLVPPNDAKLLSSRIGEVLADAERRLAMSRRNLATAREYQSHILEQRRNEFYRVLRAKTAEWLNRGCASALSPKRCV